MYPWDKREPEKAGKLRLMYEANPMSWLIEQAVCIHQWQTTHHGDHTDQTP